MFPNWPVFIIESFCPENLRLYLCAFWGGMRWSSLSEGEPWYWQVFISPQCRTVPYLNVCWCQGCLFAASPCGKENKMYVWYMGLDMSVGPPRGEEGTAPPILEMRVDTPQSQHPVREEYREKQLEPDPCRSVAIHEAKNSSIFSFTRPHGNGICIETDSCNKSVLSDIYYHHVPCLTSAIMDFLLL